MAAQYPDLDEDLRKKMVCGVLSQEVGFLVVHL